MFSRLYLIAGIFALITFGYAQYRGTSPFDAYADSASQFNRSASRTFHK